jgi:lysophospholipase L1-like esterase
VKRLLLAIAAFATIGAADPAPNPLPLHVGGRVIKEADGSLSFGWPGTYFESRFRGTGVRVKFDAPNEYMRLFIDGQEKLLFKRAGKVDLIVDGLAQGDHVARLEKLTESQSGGGKFTAFYPTPGDVPLPIQARARQIEFIGDSHTVGYGNTSKERACPGDLVHDTTDMQQAFGPLVAKKYDADYRINAFSGQGVVRNYGGGSPDSSLPILYPRLKPDTASAIAGPDLAWHPQVIVINLGTNDFSTPLKAGERWKDEAALKADYRNRYIDFVSGLRKVHPNARFILLGSDLFYAELQKVAAALNKGAAPPVSTVQVAGMDLQACDWHPSLSDHQLMAGLVDKEIQRLGVWN